MLLPLCSCTLGQWIVGAQQPDSTLAATPSYDDSALFRAFNNPWVGRSRDELVATLGPPDAIYEARHRFGEFDAGIPAVTYVYKDGVESNGGCIDAYVVDVPTGTVIKYYCQ